MRKILTFAIVLFMMTGCGTDSPNASSDSGNTPTSAATKMPKNKAEADKAIATAQAALYDKEPYSFDASKAKNLVVALENYFNNFPTDAKTPEYLFRSGELYRSLKKYNQEIDVYKRIIEKYPDYEKAPQSLFLLGFCYENNLGKLEDAKKSYSNFLNKYPKHEMAKAAEFSLKNLGRDPAEIIKEFEQKNKGKK